MNSARIVRESLELEGMLRLVESIESLMARPATHHQAMVLLASLEARLRAARRRMLVAALTNILWSFMDYDEGSDAWLLARQLLVELAADGQGSK